MDRCRCAALCGDRTFCRPRHVALGNISQLPARRRLRWRSRIRQRGIQRAVWTRLRGSIRHGRQRVHVGLHDHDISGSAGDGRPVVLHQVPGGVESDLRECRHTRRTRPRARHDQRNDHHGDAGHRATERRSRVCGFLGGGGPVPARCTDHVEAGRSDPVELPAGVGNDRRRNGSELGDRSRTDRLRGRHRRPCRQAEHR